MRRTPIAGGLALAVLCLSLAGCTQSGGGEPVRLRLGTDDGPDVPSADQIQHFADEVADLSDGRITIEPVWGAAGQGVSNWDQAIAQLAIDGDLDLALVPSRSWDALGVTSLRPLNAPFVVDSDALVEEVLTSDLAEPLLSGLDAAGVEGLGMWPEGLRHPFGFDAPVDTAAAFDGAVVRTATSTTVGEVFQALGATTNDHAPSVTEHTAMESSYLLFPGGVATANITFYPKVNVLVGNEAALAGLGASDLDILTTAAERTQAWAFETLPTDAEAGAEFCAEGGSIALAADAEVDALVAATASVRDDIAADPGNAAVLDTIAAMKAELPPAEPAAACESAVAAPGGTDPAANAVLDGTYRTEVTAEQLIAGGASETDAAANAGTYTFVLDGGTWRMHWEAPDGGESYDGQGTYEVVGDTVTFVDPTYNGVDVFTWERDPGRSLSMTATTESIPGNGVIWGNPAWQEIPEE